MKRRLKTAVLKR